MVLSGQYYASRKWLVTRHVSSERAERLWKIDVTPETGTLADIDIVFFDSTNEKCYYRFSHCAEMMISDDMKRSAAEENTKENQESHTSESINAKTLLTTGATEQDLKDLAWQAIESEELNGCADPQDLQIKQDPALEQGGQISFP
ncbi:hypothetical protein R1flu_007658 [Riccia fluitans]|uniref:Uncharacterized protein n=1 Tax=Riccia fluitans TaxID=41844 RepID=A0ABD1Z0P4_9MARC